MIVAMFDMRCDGCGENLNEPKVADWVLTCTAQDRGWQTKGQMLDGGVVSEYDLCMHCKPKPKQADA